MYMFRLSIGVTVEIPRNVEFDSLMNYWRKEMRLGDANFFLSLFFLKQFLSQREERKRYYTKDAKLVKFVMRVWREEIFRAEKIYSWQSENKWSIGLIKN